VLFNSTTPLSQNSVACNLTNNFCQLMTPNGYEDYNFNVKILLANRLF